MNIVNRIRTGRTTLRARPGASLAPSLLLVLVAASVAAPVAARSVTEHVILPPEGFVSNRLHLQFRWVPRATLVGDYRLQIVEDDGSADPFQGVLPIRTHRVDGTEPRTVVTSGLEFGRSYAWRVVSLVRLVGAGGIGATPMRSAVAASVSPVRRFETAAVPIDDLDNTAVPVVHLVHSAGPGVVQPGVTLWAVARRGTDRGHVVGVDEEGKLILHLTSIDDSSFGDTRLMDNGRLLWNDRTPRMLGGQQDEVQCRTAMVGTLDGRRTWQSSTEHCETVPPDTIPRVGVHHEVFPLPADAPRGANFLLLEYDSRFISYTDVHDGTFYPDLHWQGDLVSEVDRHTREVLRSWSTFDGISLDDHLPLDHDSGVGGPGDDWNHANAAIYDVVEDRVWVSLREQSRMVALDWSVDPPQVELHLGDDSIVASTLYQGPFPSGDVDFGDNFFSFPHAPEVLPSGNLLVYNNGNYIEPYDPNVPDRRTTAVEIAFDDPAAPTSATIVNEITLLLPDLVTSSFAPFVGDADRLPNGNTLINDGPAANIMELDPAGNAVWFLDAGPPFSEPAGVLIYRAERVPALVVDTPGDTDGDWDLDLEDLARLQIAYPTAGAELAFPETLCDHDADGDLDVQDVHLWTYWLTGPGW